MVAFEKLRAFIFLGLFVESIWQNPYEDVTAMNALVASTCLMCHCQKEISSSIGLRHSGISCQFTLIVLIILSVVSDAGYVLFFCRCYDWKNSTKKQVCDVFEYYLVAFMECVILFRMK